MPVYATETEIRYIEGIIPEIKTEILPTEQLFNTNDLNQEAKISTFLVPGDVSILAGDQEVTNGQIDQTDTSGCGGYKHTCATAGKTDITADFPMIINHMFPQCVEIMTTKMIQAQGADAAKAWSKREIVYGWTIVAANATVVTEGETAFQKIDAAVEQLTSQGVPESEIIVVVSPAMARELRLSKENCCDINMFTANKEELYANTFGVRLLIKAPADMYNAMASAGASFDVIAYPFATTVMKRFCVKDPYFVNITSQEYIDDVTMLKAKELIKVDNLESRATESDKYLTWARVGGTQPEVLNG